ncbi:hexamerin 5 precursor [Tribolium castaneum]|uniref:Larval serum protein 2-like Protein n=1 Tax=Tribolium castaneum TaxID=7070 RepID=D6WXB6_TRICA|nr:hexamerin 5 precursor [Tribolium castaneum]EFA09253.1 Larval serum protein 2-like Protein [Tribolium castaneum]|eukprot:NP_001164204.1 hexamerin 5 precursor [Tribolium castaneum]
MKIVVIFLCLCGSISSLQEYGVGQRKFKVSDKLFLERQRDLLDLYRNVNQLDFDENRQKIAKSYAIEANVDAYVNSTAVKQFVSYYKLGLLPRGEIFSIFYYEHRLQAISLFKLFYYARDFDTLYKTAVWARNNVNEGLFLYAFSTALVHRDDTFTFVLPPIYEIYPFYFYNSEDLEKAQRYKQAYSGGAKTYTIYSNYSGYYLNLNKEQSLSYFLEDVGLNAFYYYCNIYYPFWMDGDEFKLKNDRRGEQYYYLYQQLLARYYLERLSNDFGEVEFFNYDEPFKYGYYSSLRYPTGLAFPNRPNYAPLSETRANFGQSWTYKSAFGYSYSRVQDFERRISDTIDAGFAFTKSGKLVDLYSSDQINVLGNMIESNPDSVNPRYYGPWDIYGRHLLGYSYQPLDKYKVAPSALEHFETALRDPAFYQLYKKILMQFFKYKIYLPPYTYNELNFPGVKIEKFEVDKLFTYFDYFDSDVTNAVYTPPNFQWDNFKVKVRQQRLNHKPFTLKIYVNSDKVNDAVVRLFLGPKYDEYGRKLTMTEKRLNFVELDTFRYKLQSGENVIERTSRDFYWYVPDKTSYRDLYKKILGALDNTESLQLDSSEAFYGFPNRLLLPKGKREGQVFQFYVIINPYQAPGRQEVQQDYYFHRVGTGMNYIDNYAFGFPFDRTIVSYDFKVPNSKFQDVTIYHKSSDDLNSSQAQNEP